MPGEKGAWGCLTVLQNYIKGDCSQGSVSLFSQITNNTMRENGPRLHQETYRLDRRKNFLTEGVVKIDNKLTIRLPRKWYSHHPQRYFGRHVNTAYGLVLDSAVSDL